MTLKEVALRLRVDYTTVRRWVRENKIAYVALPRRGKRQMYRVPRQVVLDILAFGLEK